MKIEVTRMALHKKWVQQDDLEDSKESLDLKSQLKHTYKDMFLREKRRRQGS